MIRTYGFRRFRPTTFDKAAIITAVCVSLAIVLAACSSASSPANDAAGDAGKSSVAPANESSSESSGESAGETQASTIDTSGLPTLPSVEVDNITGGNNAGTVDLTSVANGTKPVVIWAWAPHCPYCQREAPDVEAFSEAHADAVDVVGLGTQDNLAKAEGFVNEYGLTFPMLWDASGDSWRQIGFRGQPAGALVTPDGVIVKTWHGSIPEAEVLATLPQL